MDPGSQVALASPLELCPSCGRTSREGASCPHCGKPILVDVRLKAPVPTDPGIQFKAARLAAESGLPGVTFGTARAAISSGAPLATRVARDGARRLVEALEDEGFRVAVKPAAVAPAARAGGRRAIPLVAAGLAAVLVASLAAVALLRMRGAPAPEAPLASATPAPAPAPAARGSEAEPARQAAPAGQPSAARSDADVFRQASPALATVSCPGRLGSGFFVGPDRLLTNAHVTCGAKSEVTVKLPRGRELIGRVKTIDEWLDYAVVDVVGAQIHEPIPPGDSTALEPGQPVLVLGNPMGLEATLHEGRVSAVARNLQGVAHVQINADVNPGNSGGPLLDLSGRVVGIVTLGWSGAGGLGFALPVEYALAAAGMPAGSDDQRQRWQATLASVKSAEEEDAKKLADQLSRAVLLSASAAPDGLAVSVMKRDPGGSTVLELEVRQGGTVLCEPTAVVPRWVNLKEKLDELAEDVGSERRVRWMVRRGLADGVEGGLAQVSLGGCPKDIPSKSVVMLKGDADQALPFPVHEIAEARREKAALADRIEGAERAQDESQWRAAFQAVRGRVTRLEAERDRMKKALDEQRDAGATTEARDGLPRVEVELAKARSALDDLERLAASRGVPLEWRR